MLLSSCLEGLDYKIIKGDINLEIESIAFDSREALNKSLFVAISGFAVDGHQYIKKAIEGGAVAIIVEKDVDIQSDVTCIKVDNSRLALACVSSNFYQNPTRNLNLVGITGTNGKTSISYFIKVLLDRQAKKTGVVGTMGTLIGERKIETPNTTPESLTLQRICDEMVKESVDFCIMEVSSHALDLNRVAFCDFKSGIFTNLTPDHLELHKDMAHYFEAKAKLFDMTNHANIINDDDSYGKLLADRLKDRGQVMTLTYGLTNRSDVYATDIVYGVDHSIYTAVTPVGEIKIRVNIPGEIYVYNSLAVVAWGVSESFTLDDIAAGIDALKGVKGRFETVYEDKMRRVVIDFAHTEDGLEKALDALRPFTRGRLLLVFGVYAAPGALGLGKRIAMGKVAALKSDLCFVTSDNPKDQDPNAIIADVVKAVESENGQYVAIVDRQEAIERALETLRDGDVLLISGKGHETAQVIGKVEVPFNETEIVLNKMRQINMKQ